MVYITHIRMSSGGTGHEHIVSVMWRNPANGKTDSSTTPTMVDWIENKDGIAKVEAGNDTVAVGVVDHKYLRTYADKVWTNNLLSLPRY